MAAYAAVVSLHHTINALLLNQRRSQKFSKSIKTIEKNKIKRKAWVRFKRPLPVSGSAVVLNSSYASSREMLELAYKEASSLLQALEGLNGSNRSRSSMERVDVLEGQIRDAAHKLEDVLEFHELKLEEEEEDGDEGVMRQEIRSYGEAARRLEKEYLAELSKEDNDADEDTKNASSEIDFGVEMIGRSNLFNTILKQDVLYRMRPDDRYVFVFSGKEGSGTRVVAKTLFENSREVGEFERWGWTRVRGYDLKHVLLSLIAQVEPDHVDLYYELLSHRSIDRLSECLYKALENRRYMILLDGVDDVELIDYLRNKSFPDEGNGSVVIVTTISPEVLPYGDYMNHRQTLIDLYEEFWNLIRNFLFGRDSIPPELEVAGKQIVRNSRLLRVSVAKTFIFLHKSDKTVEQWSKLAADKENIIFTVTDEISESNEIEKEIQSIETHVDKEALAFISSSVDFSLIVEKANIAMFPQRFFPKMQIISFFGMAGIGKSNFVRNIFKDNSTFSRFDHHVWIHAGPRYRTEEILIDILTQIYPHIPKLDMKANETLSKELCAQIFNKRCLIVLDDLCSQSPLHHLREIFSAIKGTILVTTRLPKVAKFGRDDKTIEMQLLDEEESWCLLCKKVFELGLCPPELEKVGRKIAKKCDGLPLLILTVACQLCKVEQSEEYWENVASGKEKSVFKNAHHQISEALLPSYHNIPQHLKPCFLYMGVFLESHYIPTSNLSNLWISEGFLKSNLSQMEEYVTVCLSELIDLSLIMNRRSLSDSPITACRLHSIYWHLSNRQAANNKLFHPMNNYNDCSIESVASQRRLCIRDGILLSVKDVQESMASSTNVHSIICVGPLHQYPVPLNFDWRLLRVMNALTIRLFEFPTQVTGIFHLRYLSLTCNGELPASISKLQKLQCLIVKWYMNIKSSKLSSYLPLEIWDMKELKHLQFMGGCLPDHKHGRGLLKLSTLLDVSPHCCREEVLKWIPNLKRLGIRIELAPIDECSSFYNLNDIYHLDGLESLKCVVVNPQFGSKNVPPSTVISMFPPNLKKLSLSGLGYPWEHMSRIGKLKNLEVLKLKCFAFRGPKWEMDSTGQFEKLKFLLLEDTNLVKWKLFGGNHLRLERLCIKHCYKLLELPLISFVTLLQKMEIMDCPLLETTVEKIDRGGLEVNIHRSWLLKDHRE